jgi:hypothetical protein
MLPLVAAAALMLEADPPADTPLAAAAAAPARADALAARYAELERDRPSIGGPTGLLAAGGLAVGNGAVLALLEWYLLALPQCGTTFLPLGGCRNGDASGPTFLIGLGLTLAAVGLVSLISGAIWLPIRKAERKPYTDEMERIEKQLDFQKSGAAGPPNDR